MIKFSESAGIPVGLSSIFEKPGAQQAGAELTKNRLIQKFKETEDAS